jgi:hypothetical protein
MLRTVYIMKSDYGPPFAGCPIEGIARDIDIRHAVLGKIYYIKKKELRP